MRSRNCSINLILNIGKCLETKWQLMLYLIKKSYSGLSLRLNFKKHLSFTIRQLVSILYMKIVSNQMKGSNKFLIFLTNRVITVSLILKKCYVFPKTKLSVLKHWFKMDFNNFISNKNKENIKWAKKSKPSATMWYNLSQIRITLSCMS